MEFKLSSHARQEIERRNIPLSLIDEVMRNPQQIGPAAEGMQVYQSKFDYGSGKMYLLRIIVDENALPSVIVTAYRTSKIEKYWRKP